MTSTSYPATLRELNSNAAAQSLQTQLAAVQLQLQQQAQQIQQVRQENQQLKQQVQSLSAASSSATTPTNQLHHARSHSQQLPPRQSLSQPSTTEQAWQSKVDNERTIIQQLNTFLRAQKHTLRDIMLQLQAEQQRWKADRHAFNHRYKHHVPTDDNVERTQRMQKHLKQLNGRKKTLDASAHSLNNDILQLRAIKAWLQRKENGLNVLNNNVQHLLTTVQPAQINQPEVVQAIDAEWQSYVAAHDNDTSLADIGMAAVNDNVNGDADTNGHSHAPHDLPGPQSSVSPKMHHNAKSVQPHQHPSSDARPHFATPPFHVASHHADKTVKSPIDASKLLSERLNDSTMPTPRVPHTSHRSAQSAGKLNGNTIGMSFAVHQNEANDTVATQHHAADGDTDARSATAGHNDLRTPKSNTLLREMLSTWISQRKLLNDSLQERMKRLREQTPINLTPTTSSDGMTTTNSSLPTTTASSLLDDRRLDIEERVAGSSPKNRKAIPRWSMFASPTTKTQQTRAFDWQGSKSSDGTASSTAKSLGG